MLNLAGTRPRDAGRQGKTEGNTCVLCDPWNLWGLGEYDNKAETCTDRGGLDSSTVTLPEKLY